MNEIDLEIRRVLETEAESVEVPEGLADRTLSVALSSEPHTWRERVRARRDARDLPGGRASLPAMAVAGAAALLLVALFAVGSILSSGPEQASTLSGPSLLSGETRRESSTTSDAQAPDDLAEESSGLGAVAAPGPPTAPELARTAEIELKVTDGRFERAWSEANEIAGRHGGFVTESRTETSAAGDRIGSGTLTARVPTDNLDAALGDFRSLGTVVRQSSSGTDVSGQIVDLDARLRSARSQEAQLHELMERAQTVADVLRIRESLDSVRTEIERLEASKQGVEVRVAYATLTASLVEDTAAAAGGLAGALDTAIDVATTILRGLVVTLGALVPLALLGLAGWAVLRLYRRRRA